MTSDRLKIAFVVHDYNRHGGHSRYVVELATRFRRDHEVHVYTNTVDESDREDLTFHHVPAWRRNALTSILSFVPPATLAVPKGFDVVHSQGLCGLRHNVATAHFCQAAWFESLKREGVELSWRQVVFRRLVTGLERRALCKSSTRRVIAVSERVREDLRKHYGRGDGTRVVYHGTDLDRFHPRNVAEHRSRVRRELGIDEARFVALYVGDLKKGASAAIRTIAQCDGATLLIVSASDATECRSLAAEVGVEDRVVFLGHSRSVEAMFAAADAFLFPTVYDPFGLVVTEAMASGLPVVTTRMAGASELIIDGESGLLVDRPWDAPRLAEHVARLQDDAGLRRRLGEAARAAVETRTWDRTARETMEVYREVVEESQSGAGRRTSELRGSTA